jgi:tetratricopeptide (TPR) repeat protein
MSQRRRSPTPKSQRGAAPKPAPAAETAAPAAPRLGWLWGAGIFALAALVRLLVGSQLGETALFRWPQLDSLEYLVWARKVASGTMIWPVPPPHGPGYPTFLGLLLRLFDDSLDAARRVQALFGAGTCILAAAVAARAFGRRAGIAAGLLLAVYGPLVFLDVSMLAEGLLVFLLLLALWLFVALAKPFPRAIAAGLVLGIAALVRPTAVVVLPALLLVLLWGRLRDRRAWAAAGLLLAAFFLVTTPVVAKISRVNGAFVPVQGYGGFAYYIGNSPNGDGLPSPRLGRGWEMLVSEAARAGMTTPAAEDQYYRRKAAREIREHPGAYLRLLAGKALWLVQAEEVRDSHSYDFFQSQSRLLGILPGLGLLFPLAVCGIGLAVIAGRRPHPRPSPSSPQPPPGEGRQEKAEEEKSDRVAVFLPSPGDREGGAGRGAGGEGLLLLGLSLAGFAAVTVLTMVGTRYRIPLVPFLAAFAGIALIAAWDAARSKRLRELGFLAAGFVAAFALAHARSYPPSHNFAEEWALSGRSYEEGEDFVAAQTAYDRALAADPNYVSAWEGIGRSRLKQGDTQGAEQALRTALRIDPQSQRAHYYLAIVLRQTLRADEAEKELRTVLAMVPDDLPALHTLGEMLLNRGETAEAEPLFRKIVAVHPDDAAAHLALARIAGAQNRPQDGLAAAKRATELDPENPEAWLTLTRLALGAQDAATAEAALQRTESLAGAANPQVVLTRALLYRLQGKREAVDELLRSLLRQAPTFRPAAELFLANAAEMGQRAEAEAFLRGESRP